MANDDWIDEAPCYDRMDSEWSDPWNENGDCGGKSCGEHGKRGWNQKYISVLYRCKESAECSFTDLKKREEK